MAFKKMRRLTACLLAAAMVLTASPVSPVRAAEGASSYKDGTYEGAGTATDQEEENFGDYAVTVSVTVKDGVIEEVVPDVNAGLDGDNDSYIKYALEGRTRKKVFYPSVLEQVKGMCNLHAAYDEDENLYYAASDSEGNEVVIDAVSGATCTSNAILEAAVNALADAAEEETEAPTEAPTEEVTEAPTEAPTEEVTEAPTEAPTEEVTEAPTEAPTEEVTEAPTEEPTEEPADASAYVMMNIPFAEFYAAEVNNDVKVDAFTSATLNKSRTPRMAGATYHKQDGSEVTGVRYPVYVEDLAVLADYEQITDESSYEVTVTNRGQTTTTVYTGQDALFGAPTYAYYVLGGEPAYYKSLSVSEDGGFTFSASTGEVTEKTAEAELLTDSSYGDYQLNFESADALGLTDADVHAIVVNTKEGAGYGMRPLENIWLKYELAWCTGFTESVHGCPVSAAHYAAMMGQTITDVKYYTTQGIFDYDIEDIYVPVKTSAAAEVEDALVTAGSTSLTLTDLPEDFAAEYTVEGLDDAAVSRGRRGYSLTYNAETAKIGTYTLIVSDANGKYAPFSAAFELYTNDIPAVYDGDAALVMAEDAAAEDFAAYLAAITSVTVNGTPYAAKGRGAVAVVNSADGTIDLSRTIAADTEGEISILITANGYADMTFVMNAEAIYVLMNLPYSVFYNTDEVDVVTSATSSKWKNQAGTYYGENQILGVSYPVIFENGTDLSGLTRVSAAGGLAGAGEYAYALLGEKPAAYYEGTVADGKVAAGDLIAEDITLEGVTASISNTSNYGDYQINVDGYTADGVLCGVQIVSEDGAVYALRHLENIWRSGMQLAWSTGFTTTERHGNALSYEHYKDLAGKTIKDIIYTTTTGRYHIPAELKVTEKAYVQMNIPYADFYASEVRNETAVDVYTSATMSKPKMTGLAGGTYHKADGSEITGITYPVLVNDTSLLEDFTEVTDDTVLEEEVNNHGNISVNTYTGKDALFGAESYAYYKMNETPAFYKSLTLKEDGSLSFGKSTGTVVNRTIDAELLTQTNYGDYQLNLGEGPEDLGLADDTVVSGAVINTKEGTSYGLRALENIWRKYELAWCTGFTESVHGCPVSAAHYAGMMGQTITEVKYFTSEGIFVYDIEDTYVPVKTGAAVTVADALVGAGSTSIEVTGLGEGFDPVYTVEGLEAVSVTDGTLTYDAETAKIGSYTLTITDASGVYAPISTSFQLYTTEIPAAFNGKDALAAADGASEEDFAAYLAAITRVTVNETTYSAKGRGAKVIINQDGSINLENAGLEVICGAQFTVTATGYAAYSFTAEHDYVKETVKASVNEDGSITYTCSVCGDKKETIIPRIASVVLEENKFIYDGQEHAVNVVVTDAEGNVIPEKYYVLKQTVSASAVGRYTVAVAFKGRYTGVVKKTFKISPAEVAINSIKGTAGRFRVVFGQRSDDMDGIQIEYSTSPDFADSVKVNTTLAAKNIYVEAGTYYVRIRTYKRIEGKPALFSAWSAAEEVIVK